MRATDTNIKKPTQLMSSLLYHINPDRNKPWNTIPDLPPNKELYHNLEILEKLVEAKTALARLHGRSAAIPNQGLLINTISLQEAKISSELENIFTTDDDLYKAYSDNDFELEGPSKEVLRYREALWSGHSILQQNPKFDLNYFIQTFQEIKQTSDEIRPSFSNTTIKKGSSGSSPGKVVYTPPRGEKIILEKLNNLFDFLNDDEKYKIDPLIKMAIAHFQFEAIHPFRDGNGRTGRIFNINYLTHQGLLDTPILFLSRYILDNKEDYYSGLEGISQRGDWKFWILFMLTAIERTSEFTFHKINEIIEAKDNILAFLSKDSRKFRNLERLVEAIFTQPFSKVKHFTSQKIYAENTARSYLNRLVELRVLERKTIEGHHYYLNLELHRILSE